jgi:hypothetical protein
MIQEAKRVKIWFSNRLPDAWVFRQDDPNALMQLED